MFDLFSGRLSNEAEFDITIMNIKLLILYAIKLTSDEIIEQWLKCLPSILMILKNFVEGKKEE